MKLRITHNSIRIRIRKSELVTLSENSLIAETVKFPMSTTVFSFALAIDSEAQDLTAQMSGSDLQISLPSKIAQDWMNTNQVGIENDLNLSDDEKLHVLIEKDFPCLDRPNEDKSDTFWELASDKPENC